MAEQASSLVVDQLGFAWPNGHSALNHCSFSIPRPGLWMLVGGNGSGKSTLLRLIAGLLTPRSGQISTPLKAALVFQNPDHQLLLPSCSSELLLALPEGLSPGQRSDRIHTALEQVGLSGLAQRPIHTLSGGQKQRLAIAGALASQASLLLLDEPTALLDPSSQAAGTVTTGWISVANHHGLLAIVQTGVLGTGATVDAKLQQAQDASGTGAKDLTGKAITQLTQAASGSAKQARDKDFQAIMPLRGKILNTWEVDSADIGSSQEVHDISVALGVDPGTSDLSGLRYHKVCILADADSDGQHIATLLCALFLRHFRPLVLQGHVFVAMPPLYRIDAGKQVFYALDDAERDAYLHRLEAEKIKAKPQVTRFKGLGEMNPSQLRETTMDPRTRRLVQLTLDAADQTDSLMDMLLAKKRAADRREWLEQKGNLVEVIV